MEIIVRTRYCIGDVVKSYSYGNLTVRSVEVHKLADANASLVKESIEYRVFNNNHDFWINENDLIGIAKGENK